MKFRNLLKVEHFEKVFKNSDMLIVIGIIGVLFIILRPLPPMVMDYFLVMNITFSVLVIITAVYVKKPLDFSVFPSLLLASTLTRLGLNIATTRLIFSNAPSMGIDAAGNVIKAFGNFVAGDNPIIGLLIFIIIIIIQFVVITKGATRIAEVAARFTLDGMPGKQMSIDADLNAGIIDEHQARERRENISREADFYGAMDGASKFVRGDAIAGIIITLINIIGGLAYGVTKGMTISQAASTFTLLTIGDGLVSQIPALIVSVAAGLVVTRQTAESNLGSDLFNQILYNPKVLFIGVGFLGALFLTPLPKLPLLLMAAAIGAVGYAVKKVTAKETERSEAVRTAEAEAVDRAPERVHAYLKVDPMELEIGYGLIRLVDTSQGGDLLDRITMIRRQTALEFGLVIPPIRIRDNMQLAPNEYVVKIRGTRVAEGSLMPDHFLAMDSGIATDRIEGVQTKEPAFGLPAYWITEVQKQRAEALGYTVVDPTSVLATHITEVIKDHAEEILTREEVHRLLENLKELSPKIVDEALEATDVSVIQKVLQKLLRERVSIRDLEIILEILADYGQRTKDADILTEYVRNAMSRTICQAYQEPDGKVYVVTMDPRLEDAISGSLKTTDAGAYLAMTPDLLGKITQAVSKEIEKLLKAGHLAVILVSPQIRPHLKRIADRIQPGIAVLSYAEIVDEITVEAVGMISIDES